MAHLRPPQVFSAPNSPRSNQDARHYSRKFPTAPSFAAVHLGARFGASFRKHAAENPPQLTGPTIGMTMPWGDGAGSAHEVEGPGGGSTPGHGPLQWAEAGGASSA